MSKTPYEIKWDISYEMGGESYTWRAKGWSEPDRMQHARSGMSAYPYWFDSIEEARNNAMMDLKEYTKEQRFRHDNVESVIL